MSIAFFYEVLLGLLAVIWMPRALYQRVVLGKYTKSIFARFGFGIPEIRKGEGDLIWVHAVSVGEIKAVVPLLQLLHRQEPSTQFVISSVTETGYDEAIRSIGFPCTHLFLPFDFGWILRPILKKAKPRLVLISETDFWLRFMTIAKEYGAKIVLVNGKISESSARRLKKIGLFADELFRPIDLFCVQSREYAKRFSSLGVPEHKIYITGNLKLDQKIAQLSESERADLMRRLGIKLTDRVLVIGSTHDAEEAQLLDSISTLWAALPNLKVLLVPRHPERFEAVAKLLADKAIPFDRYSAPRDAHESIVLVDAMGILPSLYQIAHVALVGGSFQPNVGGHNILEPASFGVPVVFGPYMDNQREMVDLIVEKGGGFQMQAFLLNMLLEALLSDETERKRIGQAGKALARELEGASARTAEELNKLFAQN